jgi:hypothetical protein
VTSDLWITALTTNASLRTSKTQWELMTPRRRSGRRPVEAGVRSSSVDGSLECRGWYRKRHKNRNCRTVGYRQRRLSERCSDTEPVAITGGAAADDVKIDLDGEKCAVDAATSSVDRLTVDEGECSDVIAVPTAVCGDDDATVGARQEVDAATDECAKVDSAAAVLEEEQRLGFAAADSPCDVTQTVLDDTGETGNHCVSTVAWEILRQKPALSCYCGTDDDPVSGRSKKRNRHCKKRRRRQGKGQSDVGADYSSAGGKSKRRNKWHSFSLDETGFHLSLLPRQPITPLLQAGEVWVSERQSDNAGGEESGNCVAACERTNDSAVGFDSERSPAEEAAANITSSMPTADHSETNDDELATITAVTSGAGVVNAVESELPSVDANGEWIRRYMTSGGNCGDPDDDEYEEDWWIRYSTQEIKSAAAFDDNLLAAGRRLRWSTVDVVAATEGCRVPSAGRRLRHKAKWRVEKARCQLKTRHCRSVTNAAHGSRLYVNHRVSKQMVLVLSEPSTRYRKEISVRQIDREKGRPGADNTKTAAAAAAASPDLLHPSWTEETGPRTKSSARAPRSRGSQRSTRQVREMEVPSALLYAAHYDNADRYVHRCGYVRIGAVSLPHMHERRTNNFDLLVLKVNFYNKKQ